MKRHASTLILIFMLTLTVITGLYWFLKPAAKTDSPSKTSLQPSQTLTKESTSWTGQDQTVRIPILMYHAIHDMAPEESASANLIVAPELFEQQIKALAGNGYYFLTPEEAYQALTTNTLPQKKVVWLTFDDGNADFYTHAYPILKKYKAKATNNIITGFVQNQYASNLTVKQMLEMMKHGMSFQAHTVNHPDLSVNTREMQMIELTESRHFLNEQLKQETMTIAYPSGRYTQETLALAQEAGYKLGLTTNEGLASADDSLLSLNRVRILPTTTPEQLLSQINGD
ncbi:polysaccharide deacetylase family protein [Streptococcus suis]|nr:polysaccharide deacetylase family protein [Streptococcus suis]